MFELCLLLLSCVLAVTSVLTGYVCGVFVDNISNVFRFYDFLRGRVGARVLWQTIADIT